jgi:hypothetical protein
MGFMLSLAAYREYKIPNSISHKESRDSSVDIATRGSSVRFPAGDGNFSLHHRVQTGSGAYPASYPMSTEGSLAGDKAVGAWSWPLTSI